MKVLLLSGLCCAMLACGHKGKAPSEPEIKSLMLVGSKQVSETTLREGIATTATGWWWPFAEKKYYDPITWQSDLRRIERIYEAHGFYQAEILTDKVTPVKGGVEVSAEIHEGAPTRISSLEIQGLDWMQPGEKKKVLDGLGLAPELVFLEEHWESAKEAIRQRLRNLGFLQVVVEGRALVDVGNKEASLVLMVRPGRLLRFGQIEVRGGPKSRILPLWIWEQVRLAIPEGMLFSDEALGAMPVG